MLRKKRFSLRSLSLLLAFSFFLTDVALAAPATPHPVVSAQESLLADPALLEVSPAFAKIREVHRGPSDRLIIHIQDAHSNLSGQRNLAAALESLMKRYDVRLVLSEGGSEDCSLSELKPLAPADVWQRIAKKYLFA